MGKEEFDELYAAILLLKNTEECRKFFRDLCTPAELKTMKERLAVAKLLYKGYTYRDVAKETKASTTTVTRVAHWLKKGELGYVLVLQRLFNK